MEFLRFLNPLGTVAAIRGGVDSRLSKLWHSLILFLLMCTLLLTAACEMPTPGDNGGGNGDGNGTGNNGTVDISISIADVPSATVVEGGTISLRATAAATRNNASVDITSYSWELVTPQSQTPKASQQTQSAPTPQSHPPSEPAPPQSQTPNPSQHPPSTRTSQQPQPQAAQARPSTPPA